MNGLDVAGSVAVKDLRVESRGRYAVGVVLPFTLTLLVVFGLSVGPDRTTLAQTAPALLWLAVLFSAVIAVRRSWEREGESGGLETLVLSPVSPAAVLLGKAAAVVVQLLLVQVVAVPLAAVLLGLPISDPVLLVTTLLLGTVGIVAVGSLFGVLSESARSRETVFPLLVLPLVVPVVVDAVKATSVATVGGTGSALDSLLLLLAFDLVFAAAGAVLFPFLLED